MVSFRLGSPSGYVQGGTTRCCNHDLEQLESLLLVNRSDPTRRKGVVEPDIGELSPKNAGGPYFTSQLTSSVNR